MEAARHRDVILAHMKQLGLKLNAKESVLSPVQRTTYLGVVWDSTMMQERNVSCSDRVVHVSQESVRRPVTHCQAVSEIAGSDGSCVQCDTIWPAVHETPAVVAQDQGIFPEGKSTSHDQGLSTVCASPRHVEETLVLNLGPVLGAPCRQLSLATDASLTGWGAVMSGRSARGLWSGRHLIWHIYCLEMLAVFRVFLPDLRGHHVLVRTNNTAVVSYIIHQGGLRSRPLYKLAHQILLWSQDKFLLLRALFIPGYLNVGPDVLSRQGPRPGVWMLHPEVVKQIWRMFYQLEVDLFVIECAMSPLVLSNSSSSPRTGRYSTDMAEAASVRLSPDRSAPRSSDESTPRRCSPTVSSPVLAGPSMVLGPDFPPRRLSFGGSHQEGSPLTSRGCHSAPPPGVMENVGVAPEGAQLIASGLPAEVVETILQSRAPSTRKVYALKWKFFTSWCRARQQDPVNCPVVQFLSICRLDSLQGYPTPQ